MLFFGFVLDYGSDFSSFFGFDEEESKECEFSISINDNNFGNKGGEV